MSSISQATPVFTCLLSMLLATFFPARAQDIFDRHRNLFTPPLQYTVLRTATAISIDGDMQEQSWNKASWSTDFVDIEGGRKSAPPLKTRFKMLWDTQYLYVAVELEDPHIWSTISKRDAIIYYDNDIELFIDPDGDAHNYYEIEVNAQNTVFDLFMSKPYRNGGMALINWDLQSFKSAVSIKGTLNKVTDKDISWLVEMAIPFRSVSLGNYIQVPKEGSLWRMNFSRVQWDTDINGGRYVKKFDAERKRNMPENNWVWSPQGVINMHYPERWGYIHFTNEQQKKSFSETLLPGSESFKKYLWLIYYKQKDYYARNSKYTGELTQLNIPAKIDEQGVSATLLLEGTARQFYASIKPVGGNEGWQINQDGRITKFSY